MKKVVNEKISIQRDELRSLIYEYHSNMLNFSNNLYGILSITVTLLVCLIGTSYFNDLFLFKGFIWQKILKAVLAFSFILLGFEIVMLIKNRKILKKNYLFDLIIDLSTNRERYYLCLIFYRYINNKIQIYFEYDKQWFKCFLLPGFLYQSTDSQEIIMQETRKHLEKMYNFPKDTFIQYDHTNVLTTKKMSYYKKIETVYHFRFALINVSNQTLYSLLKKINLKAKKIDEMYKHKNTKIRNFDVLDFLRDKLGEMVLKN